MYLFGLWRRQSVFLIIMLCDSYVACICLVQALKSFTLPRLFYKRCKGEKVFAWDLKIPNFSSGKLYQEYSSATLKFLWFVIDRLCSKYSSCLHSTSLHLLFGFFINDQFQTSQSSHLYDRLSYCRHDFAQPVWENFWVGYWQALTYEFHIQRYRELLILE